MKLRGICAGGTSRRFIGLAAAVGAAMVVAGCSTPAPHRKPQPKPQSPQTVCQAAAPGDPAVGVWLSKFRRAGVAGEFRVLLVFSADGTARYENQLKRAGIPPQGLSETGCWHREGNTLTMRSTRSNGVPVEPDDPAYLYHYAVVSQTSRALVLRGATGLLDARRMSPAYRLPY